MNEKSNLSSEMSTKSEFTYCSGCNRPFQPQIKDVTSRSYDGVLITEENQMGQNKIYGFTPKTPETEEQSPTKIEQQKLPAEQPPPVGQNKIEPDTLEMPNQLPIQESFFENIMRMNQGKIVDVHMNFNNSGRKDEIFTGKILAGGRDNIILENVKNGQRILLLTVFLDYVVFHGEINFSSELAFGPNGEG